MSKTTVFSIYDRASAIYGAPFYSHNQQTAIRSVTAEITRNDPSSPLATCPSDFDLFELGTYDQDTGRFDTHENPLFLFSCQSLVPRPAPISES